MILASRTSLEKKLLAALAVNKVSDMEFWNESPFEEKKKKEGQLAAYLVRTRKRPVYACRLNRNGRHSRICAIEIQANQRESVFPSFEKHVDV